MTLRPLCWIGVLSLTLATHSRAEVSSADSAAAQALFDQGKQLMAEGSYSQACAKLEESQRLEPTSGTLINLADCYEKVGKLATAWTTFLDAASAANRAGNQERERAARERAQALVPILPKIMIKVAGDNTAGMEVRRDGTLVGPAQWGAKIPADQGEHRVTASAPRRKSWESTVMVPAKGETVTVVIPELEPLSDTGAAPASGPTPTAERPTPTGLGAQRTIGLVAGGLGVAGVVVGSVFGLISKSKHDDADKHCTGSVCRDEAGVSLKRDALMAGNVSTAAFVVGAVGLVGGVTLWLTAPKSAAQVGVGPGSLLVKGTW